MTKKTQRFTNARLNAVQAIYSSQITDKPVAQIIFDFIHQNIGHDVLEENDFGEERFVPLADADSELFSKIVQEATNRHIQLDDIIFHSLSDGWDKDRIEILLRSILRAGLAEFFVQPDLDAPIIINEYTDIAASFYDGPEPKLVNAILDKFAKALRG